ncbi:ATP-binding protein [soil metagenome]
MFYKRDIIKKLKRVSKFPVVAILGPRQSGKTTLAKNHFKKHLYFSLENPMTREFAISDPERFLREHENKYGIILDEFQNATQILSYIQLAVDEKKRQGYFVLTGSQNYLMNEKIAQSLAGRVGILTLLPLSLHELDANKLWDPNIDTLMIKGFYPRIYSEKLEPYDVYPDYIQTYIERDVRQLANIGDLRAFQKFMALCAGRIGQQLNLSDIAANCSISVPTANKWLSILEAGYIVYTLAPYYKNFNKRLTKTPKLYFYDTGLACSLLGITTPSIMSVSPFRGSLFENLIIGDLCKQYFNKGERPPLYFWREQNGRIEIDCIIDQALKLSAIEIKSSETTTSAFLDNLAEWNELSQTSPEDNYLIYAGKHNQTRSRGNVISWQSASTLVAHLEKKLIKSVKE